MNYKMMGRFVAQILAIEGAFIIPALILSLVFGESGAAYGFALTLVAIIAALYFAAQYGSELERILGLEVGISGITDLTALPI